MRRQRKKMTAQKLRNVQQMLHRLTQEELETEVEEVEALAVELMDTDEMEELEASETTIPFLELKTGIKAWLEEQASTMDSLEIKEY